MVPTVNKILATGSTANQKAMSLALIFVLVLLANSVPHSSSQRISRLWWNDFKASPNNSAGNTYQSNSYNYPSALKYSSSIPSPVPLAPVPVDSTFESILPSSVSSNFNGPSDDELLTQASRLNSKMIRMPSSTKKSTSESSSPESVPKSYRRAAATSFDDDSSSASNIFGGQSYVDSKPRAYAASSSRASFSNFPSSGSFRRRHEDDNPGANRIWSYFDTAFNKGKSSKQQQDFSRSNSRYSDTSADDYISKQFKRVQNGVSKAQSNSANKKPSRQEEDNKVLKFNFNRKKNPEEKEKWRQLIQNIFDSTPRKSVTDYGPSRKFKNESIYSYSAKSNHVESLAPDSKEEDILGGEQEENVILKDSAEKDGQNWSRSSENLDLNGDKEDQELMQDKEESELSEPRSDEEDEEEEEEEDNQPISREEDEEDDGEEENQYLRKQNNQTEITSAKRSVATVDKNSFGTRINHSTQRPEKSTHKSAGKFNMHFSMGQNELIGPKRTSMVSSFGIPTTTESFPSSNQMMSALESDELSTTPSTLTSTDLNDVFDDLDNSTDQVTTEEPDLKSLLITNRKQQRVGKWMDSETFELNDDDLDDEEAADNKSVESTLLDNEIVTKMVNSRINKHKSIMSTRIARQNSALDVDASDDIARLAKTLQGIPGQDYPIFGSIPKTSFNCRDHQWPGYYADVDTQCQVFHICQQGGRKDSFLCPNGTMFNQQLFVCDWWHNVQCEEVPEHYGLNEKIYDYNWESKRTKKANLHADQPSRINIRRMAVMDDTRNELEFAEELEPKEKKNKRKESTSAATVIATPTSTTPTAITTTTLAPAEEISTTEQSLFTDAAFGTRKTKKNYGLESDKSEQHSDKANDKSGDTSSVQETAKAKRFSSSGTKGGASKTINSLSSVDSVAGQSAAKFSKLVSSARSKSPSTSSTFYHRYKYASQQPTSKPRLQLHPPPQAKSSRYQVAPVSSSSTSALVRQNRGKYYRT